MMVGPSGSGKSTAWRVLLKALERVEGVEGVAHIIDPKVCSYVMHPYHTVLQLRGKCTAHLESILPQPLLLGCMAVRF